LYAKLVKRVRAPAVPILRCVNPSTAYWTGARNKRLRDIYTALTKAEIMAEFPGKSWSSIRSHAKVLGCQQRQNGRDWKIITETYIATHDMLIKPSRKDVTVGHQN
jgi:hypothetical protein